MTTNSDIQRASALDVDMDVANNITQMLWKNVRNTSALVATMATAYAIANRELGLTIEDFEVNLKAFVELALAYFPNIEPVQPQ